MNLYLSIANDKFVLHCDRCNDSYSEFKTCEQCNNRVHKVYENPMDVRDREGNSVTLCSICFPKYAFRCDGCGEIYLRSDQHRHGEGYFCASCYAQRTSIKPYDYTPPEFNTHKLNGENQLFMGVELEIETNQDKNNDELNAKKLLDFTKEIVAGAESLFYIKHDGTVKGFELVTHPATLGYMHTHMKWKEILDWCKSKKFTSYTSGNCGLHVHINKAFLSPLEVHKIRLFFTTNFKFIEIFSKRNGLNTRYCQNESIDPKILFFNPERQDGKYWAIRTSPCHKNTVEFRIFRGTLDHNRFLATLQFCDALAHFVKQISAVSCLSKNSWVEFLFWCKKQNMYNHFLNYIKNDIKIKSLEP